MLFDSTVIIIDLHDPQTGLSVLSVNLAQQTRLSQSKALAEKATSEQARADNQLALRCSWHFIAQDSQKDFMDALQKELEEVASPVPSQRCINSESALRSWK